MSAPGVGSTFSVTIPVRYAPPVRVSESEVQAVEEIQHA